MKLWKTQVVLNREAEQVHCPEETRWEVPWSGEMKSKALAQLPVFCEASGTFLNIYLYWTSILNRKSEVPTPGIR